jgi:hypothetical protein
MSPVPSIRKTLKARADDPFVLAADYFAIEVLRQTAWVVLMHGADVGPTANPLARLGVVHHQVRRANLGLEVKVAVG